MDAANNAKQAEITAKQEKIAEKQAEINAKKQKRKAEQEEMIAKANKAIRAAVLLLPPDVVQRCLAGNISLDMKDQIKTHVERIVFGKRVQLDETVKPPKKELLDPLSNKEQAEVDKNLKFLQSKIFQLVREICLMFPSYYNVSEEELEVMSEEEKSFFLEKNLKVPVQDMSEPFNAENESRNPVIATLIEGESTLPVAVLVPENEQSKEYASKEQEPKEQEPKEKPWYRRFFGGGNVPNDVDAILKRITLILQDAPPLIEAVVTLMQYKPENVVFALYGVYSKIMKSSLKNYSVNLRAKLAENLFFDGVKQYQKGEQNPFALAPKAIATRIMFLMPKLPKSVVDRFANMQEKGTAVSNTVSKNVGSFTQRVYNAFKPKVAGTRRRKATLRARGRTSSRRRAAARAGP